MIYTNSNLVSYTKISPNRTKDRNHKIDTITIHCVVGQVTVERLGEIFANPLRRASCNYGIGKDGRIGMYCEEKDRSWCSSNAANDHRAITIEVASDTTHPYAVNDKALNSLIELCADICRRNNIKELKWKGNKDLIGQTDIQNMTVHRWFANKSCPGDYLYNKHSYIADEVNKRLGNKQEVVSDELYRVRISWENSNSQIGAYRSLDNAKKNCPEGYSVYNVKGKLVYTNKVEFNHYLVKITADVLNVRKSNTTLSKVITTIKKGEIYTIVEEKNGWGKLKSGIGWISLKYTKKI